MALSLVAANQHNLAVTGRPYNKPSSATPERSSSFASARTTPKRLAGELGMSSPATLAQTNNHRAWIKLMRDGAPLEPRLIDTLAPPPPGARLAKVVAFAHARHMMSRKPVEEQHRRVIPEGPEEAAETSGQARSG